MSRKISYRGKIDMGLQDRISLATIKGKVGYKITDFKLISTTPGAGNHEYIGQIFSDDMTGSIGPVVDFTNSKLLAVSYYTDNSSSAGNPPGDIIIFDNSITNQDIFVNITDATGNTTPCNYYIELERMTLSDIQATELTLKNLRTIVA